MRNGALLMRLASSEDPFPALQNSPEHDRARGDADAPSAAGRILMRVFDILDIAGVRHCVLHGYDAYPHSINSDVDCIIGRETSPRQLLDLLHRHRAYIGAEVVKCHGYYIVLAGKEPQ